MEEYSTFESFRPHFDSLAKVAYYKNVLKDISQTKSALHTFYRVCVLIFVLTYNLQHLIQAYKSRHSTEQLVDTMFILFTTINALGKQVIFNLRTRRIDRLIDVIDGPAFAATNQAHVKIVKGNAESMLFLLKIHHAASYTCGILWAIFPLVNRAMGEEVRFTGYFPFVTNYSPIFELVHAYMTILITFQAYGHVSMDCTIISFYSQAKTQLIMLRYNLEHLVDVDDQVQKIDLNETDKINVDYKDNLNSRTKNIIQSRLAKCVEHFQKITWYCGEVESVFGEAMVIQLFVVAWVICTTAYKIVGLSMLSAEFISLAAYLVCMLAQLLFYCYYGTNLKYESELVVQSLFASGWPSLSPRFRRQLLILMVYCSRQLVPRIAYVIPMTLDTYIAVLRSSYTLYTVLDRR